MPHHWGRVLRQRVAPFIPERLKAPFRPRLFGYRPASVTLPIVFASDDRGRHATIDGRAMIRYRDQDAADFQYHLVDNGESIEEIAGFLELAESARTFFDVGAWKGLFALAFCSMERDRTERRAVAYEPSAPGIAAMTALADLNDCRPSSCCGRSGLARLGDPPPRASRPAASFPSRPMRRAATRSTPFRSCRSTRRWTR